MTTINFSKNLVSVFTSDEFDKMLADRPLSNVVLRNKNKDEIIVLERVGVYAEKDIPTIAELKNAWDAMFFNTWIIKFTIEENAHKDLKCGNIFRNLDKFDVLMFLGGKIVFDTSALNLTLIEGRIGITPKSRTREQFATKKGLKKFCLLISTSAWKMLNIEVLVAESLAEATKEVVEEEKKEEKPTSKTSKATGKRKKGAAKEVKTPEATEVAETEELKEVVAQAS